MPSFLSGLKSPRFLLLVFVCLLVSPATHAQQERWLQQVDLRLPGNKPMVAAPYTLPVLVAQGIDAGKITPYQIDYETNSLTPLTLAQYHKSLRYANIGDFLTVEEDTLERMPWDLFLLALDVTKEKGILKKINYLHFSSLDPQAGLEKYYYSVSFPQVAAYLQEVKALWIKNASPFVWRNQVLHTYNQHPANVLPAEEASLAVHLTENPKGTYGPLELYSPEQKLVKRIPDQELWPATDSSDIRWLDEALRAGLYQVGFLDPREGDEAEKKLSTTLPQAPLVASKPAPVAFSLIQTDKINPLRPENKALKDRAADLLSFVNQAIAQGRLTNLYTSADLTERMTPEDWQKHLKVGGELPASTDTSQTSKVHFPPMIILSWKIFFNDKGEITRRQPLGLGFQADSRQTETGFDYPIGYIPFEEAVKTLKGKPAVRLLAELRRRKYFAFWEGSSAISAENPPAGKRSQAK